MLNENDYHYERRSATIHNNKIEKISRINLSIRVLMCLLLCILVLSGCGSSLNNNHVPSETSNHIDSPSTFSQIAPAEISNVSEALEEMSNKIKRFKQLVESDQLEEARLLVNELVALWNAVQHDLISKDAELSGTLQEDLEALYKETENQAWNKELLIQLDYKLYQGMRDMKAIWN